MSDEGLIVRIDPLMDRWYWWKDRIDGEAEPMVGPFDSFREALKDALDKLGNKITIVSKSAITASRAVKSQNC